MRENERRVAEEKQRELEMLAVSKAADTQFAQNEEAKRHNRFQNLKTLQTFHGKQMVNSSINPEYITKYKKQLYQTKIAWLDKTRWELNLRYTCILDIYI